MPPTCVFIFRLIIRNAVNASEKDCVVFAGSGCTGAVHKLIHCLNLTRSPQPPVSWKIFVEFIVEK